MAGGLFALLDDVAALARIAAASVDDVGAAAGRASAKAAGVVVDDTAVTPQYLHGSAADRELPIIKKITIGSLRNKLVFILPAALLLSEFLPQALPVLLILGGTYLAYEGAHKVWEKVSGHGSEAEAELGEQGELTPEHEQRTVTQRHPDRLHPLRRDHGDRAQRGRRLPAGRGLPDARGGAGGGRGLHHRPRLRRGGADREDGRHRAGARRAPLGRLPSGSVAAWSTAMPRLLTIISVVGTGAMLWVGGHILLVSSHELGWHAPYDLVHHWEEAVHEAVGGVGAVLAWLVNTLASAVIGLVVGALVVAVMQLVPRRRAHGDS